MLREDACYVASLKRGDDTEDASQWMFEDAMRGGELTDMEFLLDSGRRVRGHKVWLMARCDYLRRMMTSGMRESETGIVRVRECGDGTFLALLEYIYTGRLGQKTCLGQDWGELSSLADMFGMCGMEKRLCGAVTWSSIEEAAAVAVESGRKQLLESCMKQLNAAIGHIRTVEEAITMMRVMEVVYTQEDEEMKGMLGIGMHAVIHTMRRFNYDAEVQAMGCQAILQTARSSAENLTRAGQAGAVGIAIDVLRSLWSSSRVPMEACKLLGSLVRECKGNCEMAGCARNAHGVCAVAEFMAANKAQAEVQATGFETICDLLEDSTCRWFRTLKRRMRDRAREIVKWITTFVDSLKAHRDDDEVQRAGVRALHYLLRTGHAPHRHPIDADGDAVVEAASDEASAFELGAPGTVVRAMTEQRSNSYVQMICCTALWILVDESATRSVGPEQDHQIDESPEWYEQNSNRAVEAGALEAIVQGMEAHPRNGAVQQFGCKALINLANYEDEENRRRAMDAGVVEVIVEAMHVHRTSSPVQCHGCEALHKFPGRESVKRALNAGMIEAILEGMKTHQYSVNVQTQGFRVIGRLVEMIPGCDDDIKGKIKEVRLRLVRAGAIGITLQNMRRFSSDHVQQTSGMTILMFCVVNENGGADDWGKAPLVELGGIEVIVKAMERFFDCHDLQMVGFPLLARLVFSNAIIFKRVGTEPIVLQMSVENCRLAVDAGSIGPYVEENCRLAVDAGAIEAIVKAMNNCSEDDDCSRVRGFYGLKILTALTTMGDYLENRDRAVEAGAIRTVIELAKVIKCPIGRLLRRLLVYSDIWHVVVDAGAAGGVEVLVDGIKRFELDPKIQVDNCKALLSLIEWKWNGEMELVDNNCDLAMNAGAIQAVIAILKQHTRHAKVHIAGLRVVHTLLKHAGRKNKRRMDIHRSIKAGDVIDLAVQGIVQGIKIHADNPRLFAVGCEFLDHLLYCSDFYPELHTFCDEFWGRDMKEGLDQAVEAGAMETIVTAMKSHEEIALTRTQDLFEIIHALSKCDAWNPGRKARAVEAGVIEVIVKHTKPISWAGRSSKHAFEVLRHLFDSDPSCRFRAVEAGAIEVIVEFIRDKHGSTEEIAVLHDIIGVDAVSRIRAVDAGAIEAIVKHINAMRSYGLDSTGKVIAVLRNLVDADEGSHVRAVEAGAIEVILGLLSNSTHFNNAQDFFDIIEMLTSLVADHPENCQRALNATCIAAVIAGLRQHHADGDVQIVGCELLAALLGSEKAGHADREMATNAGGVEAILDAIAFNNMTNVSRAVLPYLGCRALLAIIGDFGTRSALRRQGQDERTTRAEYERCDRARRRGGIQRIGEALQKFPNDAGLQAAGFETLMELMWDMTFGAYQIVTLDGRLLTGTVSDSTVMNFVQAAMNNHPLDVSIHGPTPRPMAMHDLVTSDRHSVFRSGCHAKSLAVVPSNA